MNSRKQEKQNRKHHRVTHAQKEALADRIVDYVSRPDYQPVKESELTRQMQIPPDDRAAATEALKGLIREGVLVKLKRKGIALAASADLLSGRITFIRSGAAFVRPITDHPDVFVPAAETGTALPGDHVLIRLKRNRRADDDRVEGTVIRVTDRTRHTLVGTLEKGRRSWYVKPMLCQVRHDVIVEKPSDARRGDRVVVSLEPWDDPRLPLEGNIIEVIGPADDPALDTRAVTKSYGLPEAFPPEVQEAAETVDIRPQDYDGRLDLRDEFIFTIDPASARDYDDAISLKQEDDGTWQLGVHIADVSHFVTPGSPLDQEARERGTSVYLPDLVIPMLPVQLSNGVCSLSPGQDRLAFSVLLKLAADGSVLDATFHKSIIHSRLRLTYHQAWSALTSADGASFAEWKMDAAVVGKLKAAGRLARRLRERRMKGGALYLELPEVEIDVGQDGRINKIEPVADDEAHQLIEEFMLLANETVCRALADAGREQIFRIHDAPDPEKLEQIADMFRAAGIDAGNLSDRHELHRVLKSVADAPQAHPWYGAVLRAMCRAEYTAKNIGHYGLAKAYYTHFTSPIRRYPDLVIHRLLEGMILDERPAYGHKALKRIATECSASEQTAMEAEREVVELKKIRYLQDQLDSGDLKEYDAVVTDVRNFGVMIDLPQLMLLGMIHVSHLDFDFFEYLPQQNVLRGRRTKVTYEVGSRLKVVVVRVDEEKRRFDFAPSGEAKAVGKAKRRKAKGGKRGRKSRSGKHDRSKADGNKKGKQGKKGQKGKKKS